MTNVEQLELEVRTHKARADHAEKSRERAWAETIELKKRVAELENDRAMLSLEDSSMITKAEIVTLARDLVTAEWLALEGGHDDEEDYESLYQRGVIEKTEHADDHVMWTFKTELSDALIAYVDVLATGLGVPHRKTITRMCEHFHPPPDVNSRRVSAPTMRYLRDRLELVEDGFGLWRHTALGGAVARKIEEGKETTG